VFRTRIFLSLLALCGAFASGAHAQCVPSGGFCLPALGGEVEAGLGSIGGRPGLLQRVGMKMIGNCFLPRFRSSRARYRRGAR
jgi:hypothetical protein